MQQFLLPILFSAWFLPTSSAASSICVQEYGEVTCGKGSTETVNANGVAKMNGTEVERHTQVNGSLRAVSAKLGTLTVNGDVILKRSEIRDVVKINGVLNAFKTQFLSSLVILANSGSLKKCELQDITFKKTSTPRQKIKLYDSKVSGSITFDGGDGIVYLCDGSKVTGDIVGGKTTEIC